MMHMRQSQYKIQEKSLIFLQQKLLEPRLLKQLLRNLKATFFKSDVKFLTNGGNRIPFRCMVHVSVRVIIQFLFHL